MVVRFLIIKIIESEYIVICLIFNDDRKQHDERL